MTNTPKKKRGRSKKQPIEMTGDELMDRVMGKRIRNKLKKLAEERRQKPEKSQ